MMNWSEWWFRAETVRKMKKSKEKNNLADDEAVDGADDEANDDADDEADGL